MHTKSNFLSLIRSSVFISIKTVVGIIGASLSEPLIDKLNVYNLHTHVCNSMYVFWYMYVHHPRTAIENIHEYTIYSSLTFTCKLHEDVCIYHVIV